MFLPTGEDDFHDVRSAVAGLAGKWQDLGSSLRLRSGDLEAILSASAHSPSDCLRKMLTLWLRENYNVCMTLIHVILPPSPFLSFIDLGNYVGQDKLSLKDWF